MRAIWSGLLSAVVVCLYALAIAAGEIDSPVTPATSEPPNPAQFENVQPVEGKKPKPPKPPKPDRNDRHHRVDPIKPQPEPDVHPIQPVGPRPDNNFRPAPPRPQPKPHDGKVIDNLIHNVPTPRPLTHWFWGLIVRAFWLVVMVSVLAIVGVVLLARAVLHWFR